MLLRKYKHIYFKDPDVDGDVEVRRVIDVEWKVMRPARDSQYNVVTQLVERNDVQEQEDDYEGYIVIPHFHLTGGYSTLGLSPLGRTHTVIID